MSPSFPGANCVWPASTRFLGLMQVVEALNHIACVHCRNAALTEWAHLVDGGRDADNPEIKVQSPAVSMVGAFSTFALFSSCMVHRYLFPNKREKWLSPR
jgi:hypothetical protein